mgnify:CR=1 FL=1
MGGKISLFSEEPLFSKHSQWGDGLLWFGSGLFMYLAIILAAPSACLAWISSSLGIILKNKRKQKANEEYLKKRK